MTTAAEQGGAEGPRRSRDERRAGCARTSSLVGLVLVGLGVVLGVVGVLSDGLGGLLALAGAALLVMFGAQALVLGGMLRWLRRQEAVRLAAAPPPQ